ncbi:hypothetical protein HDF16_003106 [Granulicella aggregans]|uniref:Uncharacterized protein n=1 Tax=Granulicella aggregans TaxID=474949 RepID=A0A7W7ZEN6_9BACT|nr:DUF5715 family protein [Granulicella aggregans]MBB5058392.1 hypothetical protein [Granulicella aggregans]
MRANAPFPVLLALTGVVSLIGLFAAPGSLLAMTRQPMRVSEPRNTRLSPSHRSRSQAVKSRAAKSKPTKQRKPARETAPAKRHVEAARHAATTRRGRKLERTSAPTKQETAASKRVHAWVREQHKSSEPAPEPKTKATMSEATGPASSSEVMGTLDAVTPPPAGIPTMASMIPTEDLAAQPMILPSLYDKRGRLVVPPALKGSHDILVHQNLMADSDGLDRIRDDEDLTRMRNARMLSPIPENATLHVDDRLPANRRYCRPWTAVFLDTLARQHYARFQTPLQLTSAVRTVAFQQRLIHTNGNAAPAEGDTASPHLTGQAIDIGKKGLTMAEIAWLRGYLLPLVQQGKLDVEEEFQQSCFHISVYKKYMPQSAATRRVIATTHREGADVLGESLR